jgi:hypothetical protein
MLVVLPFLSAVAAASRGGSSSGGSKFLYQDDPDAAAVIEVTGNGFFETSHKNRVVEFYSPYCVRVALFVSDGGRT